MARPFDSASLSCIIGRQIDDKVDYCKRLVKGRIEGSENLFRKDLLSHYGCVNAIEFSNQGDLLVSGGDDRRVLLWKVEQAIQDAGKPTVMRAQHVSNIFCLGYDNGKSKIFSAGNDDQVIVHDLRTGDPLNFFLHEKAVYGLSIHPFNDNVFSSACDNGRILIYDIRDCSSTETFCLARYKTAFHSVMFNPVEPRMLATANAKEGVSMWDVRKPLEPVLRYGTEGPSQSCMNVRYNAAGNMLLALRRRLPPVLYSIDSATHLCQFDHPGYYNSCTMKSCCFAGDDDEYVLSGSDDFNLYMWKIPSNDTKWVDSAHMILRGHRSIVNQVRFNRASCALASSGVEKIIKIWSPFPLGSGCLGGLKRDAGKQERQRRVFTHDEYIGLVLRSGQLMTHDYSHQSTREDPRMMAFFDSLVQREIESWSSEDLPAALRTPSDSENNPLTGRTYSATDSEENLWLVLSLIDSTASDRQLMLSILGSAVSSRGSSGGGMAPERSSESPNRITQLIANRREKLMRLAAMEGGAVPNWSGSASTSEREDVRVKSKSKSKSKLKGVKRKHGRMSGRRSRARKKCRVSKSSSDSDSDEPSTDAMQPSTSSGVVSCRSRYPATPIDSDARHSSRTSSSGSGSSSGSSGSSSSSSSSSSSRSNSNSSNSSSSSNSNSNSSDTGDNGAGTEKQRRSKANSDSSSSKVHRRKHRKCKNNSRRHCSKSKNKRQKTDNGTELEEIACKDCVVNGTNAGEVREAETFDSPIQNCLRLPSTPDSGITSGVSTIEKCRDPTRKGRNGDDSSDHEEKLKNFERFRKKVGAARRGYRNRSTPLSQPISTTTDSSD